MSKNSASAQAIKSIEPSHGRKPFRSHVKTLMKDYFNDLNGHKAANLYQMVLDEVEYPLLESVLQHTGGNQTKAAEILGINRSTLRKKLSLHGLD